MGTPSAVRSHQVGELELLPTVDGLRGRRLCRPYAATPLSILVPRHAQSCAPRRCGGRILLEACAELERGLAGHIDTLMDLHDMRLLRLGRRGDPGRAW